MQVIGLRGLNIYPHPIGYSAKRALAGQMPNSRTNRRSETGEATIEGTQ